MSKFVLKIKLFNYIFFYNKLMKNPPVTSIPPYDITTGRQDISVRKRVDLHSFIRLLDQINIHYSKSVSYTKSQSTSMLGVLIIIVKSTNESGVIWTLRGKCVWANV